MTAFSGFDDQKYVSLTTYKKNGDAVATPVWIVPRDGKLYVWTSRNSFKAKRLARDPRCTVAACNASGKKLLGPTSTGAARIVPDAESEAIVAALKARYGVAYHLIAFLNVFRRVGDYIVFELNAT